MTLPKPYMYKRPSNRQLETPLNRLKQHRPIADPIPLTGFVHGLPASDIEERFARALRLRRKEFQFQIKFPTATSLPGEEKNVDFIVFDGMAFPVEIDGYIGHHTGEQLGKDDFREQQLNEVFSKQGYQLMKRVKWTKLETQQAADQIVGQLFS